ncbi:hypothetical protein [Methylobacterium sp. E-016]|nr:hypothetical protein [Methylobacterium sp. E-016]
MTGFQNLPNVVRIVAVEWTAWLRLARSGERGATPTRGGDQIRHPHGY